MPAIIYTQKAADLTLFRKKKLLFEEEKVVWIMMSSTITT